MVKYKAEGGSGNRHLNNSRSPTPYLYTIRHPDRPLHVSLTKSPSYLTHPLHHHHHKPPRPLPTDIPPWTPSPTPSTRLHNNPAPSLAPSQSDPFPRPLSSRPLPIPVPSLAPSHPSPSTFPNIHLPDSIVDPLTPTPSHSSFLGPDAIDSSLPHLYITRLICPTSLLISREDYKLPRMEWIWKGKESIFHTLATSSPATTNPLSHVSYHRPFVTYPLPPTLCHISSATNPLSPVPYNQPFVTYPLPFHLASAVPYILSNLPSPTLASAVPYPRLYRSLPSPLPFPTLASAVPYPRLCLSLPSPLPFPTLASAFPCRRRRCRLYAAWKKEVPSTSSVITSMKPGGTHGSGVKQWGLGLGGPPHRPQDTSEHPLNSDVFCSIHGCRWCQACVGPESTHPSYTDMFLMFSPAGRAHTHLRLYGLSVNITPAHLKSRSPRNEER
ncbi:hypothetical protein Pmani_025860 [Petrolisthes manimaculis]|uniref:Uncharacterized protein n=1 Tax=Petrolisthes manimaculis TaxID=1843537 RepID=A0AAE1P706_9EUCA|nr:hypothetical protein Pmani_025860 [Petrolisthes manimaculis]